MSTNNGYNIIRRKNCKHFNLRSFSRKNYYVCLNCGANCQFCDACEKVFTLNTLKKYGGICGKCNSTEDAEDVEVRDVEMNNADQPMANKPQLIIEVPNFSQFQLPFFLQLPPFIPRPEFPHRTQDSVPISEMRVDKPIETEDVEMNGTVKNILAEDPQKKLWLVEWEGDEHATWEDYNTIKDSTMFKEYIEKQMTNREDIIPFLN